MIRIKSLLRYPFEIRHARKLLSDRTAASQPQGASRNGGRPIVLDLRTTQMLFDCARHFGCLANDAKAIGSPFVIRCGGVLLAAMSRKIDSRYALTASHSRYIPTDESLPDDALVLCDYQPDPASGSVQLMIGRDIDRRLPVMPYPMHPVTQRFANRQTLVRLRAESERKGVFFAGSQNRRYGRPKMERDFGILSRLDMLQTVKDAFPDRVVPSLALAASQAAAALDGPGSIVISDGRTDAIEAADWLPTLARAHFFLCCPGAAQPTCHNLVEAMSVGTIPILEYGDRITPPLSDGENAICFRGRSGLVEAIRRIAELSPRQLRDLHGRVADFYDQHLCSASFLRRLRDASDGKASARICMPFHEKNFYRADVVMTRRAA